MFWFFIEGIGPFAEQSVAHQKRLNYTIISQVVIMLYIYMYSFLLKYSNPFEVLPEFFSQRENSKLLI